MRRADIVSDIENITKVTGNSAFVQRAVQRALDRISGFTEWSFYLDTGYFPLFDDETAGDADVTLSSRSVTSNNGNTSWGTEVVNRKFRIGSNTDYYRISARASSTAITLEALYQRATATDQSYRIYNDEYFLNADVDENHIARQIQTGQSLAELDALDFDIRFPAATTLGDPIYMVPIGRSRQGDVYDVGTVTASVGGTTITGSSTDWISELGQGITRGSRLRIGNAVYTIKSVDTDTQVTIYGTITAAASGSTYEIFLDNIVVQVYPIPDAPRNIYYRYFRKPYPLENAWDEPDIPSNWHWLLIPGALVEVWAHQGNEQKVRGAEAELLRGLQEMKEHYVSTTKVFQRRSQASLFRGRGPRWPDAFPAGARVF